MDQAHQAQNDEHQIRIKRAENVLAFIRELGTRYEFPEEEQAQIENETATIERRVQDDRLYLGIVGEFSTGKSTFINALLGFELLKEDVLQGTTCAPTLLVPGEEFRISVSFSDGRRVARYPGAWSLFAPRWKTGNNGKRRDKCIRNSATFLERHTAEESVSKDVSLVKIEIPSDVWRLPPEIAIVDTPGTNSGNPRHTEVAKRAIHEFCDLCAALTSATEPCPRTLVSFIEDALSDVQNRCLGIVTQIDKLRPRERSRVLQYVNDRLNSEGIKFRKVFGTAPLLVVHPEESEGRPDADSLRADFESLVAELSGQLREGRLAAIDEKLGVLVHRLINKLLPLFKDKRDELHARAEKLENNQLIDPKAFFDEEKRRANKDLSQAVQDAFWKLVPDVNATIETFKSKDVAALSEARSISAVKRIVGRKYASELKEPLRVWLDASSGNSAKTAESILFRFHRQFNEEFRNLSKNATVQIDVSVPTVRTRPPKIDLEGVMKTIRAIDMEDTKKRVGGGLGGGGAGALVGTLIAPGIGTAVGAGIGALAGLILNGKNIDEIKTTAKTLLDTKFQTLSKAVRDTLLREANNSAVVVLGELLGNIDRYDKKHSKEILALISAERHELRGLEADRSQVESDLKRLNSFLEPEPTKTDR